MRYIERIRRMKIAELAESLKILTDLMAEQAVLQFAEENGLKAKFVSHTKISDFKKCLLSEIKGQ